MVPAYTITKLDGYYYISLRAPPQPHSVTPDLTLTMESLTVPFPPGYLMVPILGHRRASSWEPLSRHPALKERSSTPPPSSRLRLPTSLEQSNVSSRVNSVSSVEEVGSGYEASRSGSSNSLAEAFDDGKSDNLPPFWLLIRVQPERVEIYFQLRCDICMRLR